MRNPRPSATPRSRTGCRCRWSCGRSVFPIAALVVTWKVLVQPWMRERTLTFDGMFLIAWASAWALQDSWFNYTRQWFNYNAALFNLGCLQCEVPGWQSPHPERVAEPLFVLSLYTESGAYCGSSKRTWTLIVVTSLPPCGE